MLDAYTLILLVVRLITTCHLLDKHLRSTKVDMLAVVFRDSSSSRSISKGNLNIHSSRTVSNSMVSSSTVNRLLRMDQDHMRNKVSHSSNFNKKML